MKVLRVAAGFATVLVMAGCGESEQGSATVMPEVVDRQLDVALSEIEDAGFEDEVEIIGGGTFGVVDESNWQVCKQSPAAGQELTAAPELTVDRSCGEEPAESTTVPPEDAPAPTEPPTTTAPAPEPVLTPETSGDLAALLGGPDCSDTVQNFAAAYAGRTIEFDGNIAAIAPSGDYDTRFDILVLSGNFSETSASGPNFQFRNVGIADLNLTGSNIPESLVPGVNLRVIADVGEFDRNSCLFFLDPVSTTVR